MDYHQLIGFSYNCYFLEILLADNLIFFLHIFVMTIAISWIAPFYISQFVLLDAVNVTVVQWTAKISPRISL
jgi:hypothetical protein